MNRKLVSGIMFALLLTSMLTLAFNFAIVEGKDTHVALQELWVMIDKAKAHRKGYGNEGWVNITVHAWIAKEEYFDLLPLLNLSRYIATCELPVGNYTEMEFLIVDEWANTTQEPYKVLKFTTPWLTVQTSFTIKETPVETILIDITVNENIIVRGGRCPTSAKGEVVAIIY